MMPILDTKLNALEETFRAFPVERKLIGLVGYHILKSSVDSDPLTHIRMSSCLIGNYGKMPEDSSRVYPSKDSQRRMIEELREVTCIARDTVGGIYFDSRDIKALSRLEKDFYGGFVQ